jgi:hypothetical protein
VFPAPRAGGFPSPSFPVGLDGLEPSASCAAPKLRHNPSRRDPRSRTAFLLNPNQADCRLPRSRQWTTGDLNPAPPACDAGALPDELAAQGRRGNAAAASGRRYLPLWCSRYGRINGQARSPLGGAPQGRRDSNSRHAVLEAAVLPLNYVPMEMETAPRGFPWGGCRRVP